MEFGIEDFYAWHHMQNDVIEFKKIYVDISGSLNSGLLLSYILECCYTCKKCRKIEGELWVVAKREDWWEECRLTVKEYDSACKMLVNKGLVIKKILRYGDDVMTHLRINEEIFIKSLSEKMGCV